MTDGAGTDIPLTGASIAAGALPNLWTLTGSFSSSDGVYKVRYLNEMPSYCASTLTPTSPSATAAATVGTGTPESCTEDALRAAVGTGGLVKFDCGGGGEVVEIAFKGKPIVVTTDVTLFSTSRLVRINAEGASNRVFEISNSDPATLTPKLRLEGLSFIYGDVSGGDTGEINSVDSASGGVVYTRGGTLEVLQTAFYYGRGSKSGQDVGGGSIYTFGGSLNVDRSTFIGNRASNGGAIGAIGMASYDVTNSVFFGNEATGTDGNPGNGGNGGALVLDGKDYDANVCGCHFHGNTQNAHGNLFRVGYALTYATNVRSSEFVDFEAKSSRGGAGVYLQGHSISLQEVSLINGRGTAAVAGQLVAPMTLTMVNVLVYGNVATGLAAGFALPNSPGGSMTNVTFAKNEALFAAAFTSGDSTSMPINNGVFNNVATNGFNPVNARSPLGSCSGSVSQWPDAQTGGASETSFPVCNTPSFSDVSIADPSDQGCAVLSTITANAATCSTGQPARITYTSDANNKPIYLGPTTIIATVSGGTVSVQTLNGEELTDNSSPSSILSSIY